VGDKLKEGDVVRVKVLEVDRQGCAPIHAQRRRSLECAARWLNGKPAARRRLAVAQ